MFKISLCLLVGFTVCAQAQDTGYYSNRKVLSGFVEYSNDSSHMLLGYADGRKINALGVSFQKRSFLGSGITGSWVAEVRPYMSVTDPTMKAIALNFPEQPTYSSVITFTSPVPVNTPVTSKPQNVILVAHNQVYAGTATYIGGTRSTYVSGFSPVGYKLSLMPRRRVQPFVTGLAGLAFSPRDIPVFNSSSINYTFELGAGVEVYHTHGRSCQLEYRYHHLANTGGSNTSNPGIDSGVFKVSYSFGR